MATHRKDTTPGHARSGEGPATSVPAGSGTGDNSASGIIEAPQTPRRGKLDPHDFAVGGGGGGAEAFSRKKTKK
jgi:hypothetical protein